ncbi:DUF4397 domain-containing protein [Flavitalea sp.]|nr:DUF4397 domain-containing protein [Flavitalea sp.]
MKSSKSLSISCLLLITIMIAASCEKEFDKMVVENTAIQDKALVKLFNSTVSSQRTYMYLDNVPVTGSILAYGGIFPSTGYASALTQGSHTILIKDTLAASTQPQLSFPATLAPGKNYSIFTYDTVNSIKYVFTEDEIVKPADTTSRIRFTNLIFSKTPLPNVDLYSVVTGKNVFTNIALAQVTNFVPFASKRLDSLYVRETGTTTNLTPVFTIIPTINRSYTVVYRGRYQTTTGTVMPRSLTVISNY